VTVLKAENVYYFFPAMQGMGRSGVPDLICCVGGKFLAIECKSGERKPTVLQEREMEKIRSANGVTLVINERNIPLVSGTIKFLRGE